jgi:hypothetical protein
MSIIFAPCYIIVFKNFIILFRCKMPYSAWTYASRFIRPCSQYKLYIANFLPRRRQSSTRFLGGSVCYSLHLKSNCPTPFKYFKINSRQRCLMISSEQFSHPRLVVTMANHVLNLAGKNRGNCLTRTYPALPSQFPQCLKP